MLLKGKENLTSLGLQRRSAMALALGQSLGVRLTELTNSLQIQVSPEKQTLVQFILSISSFTLQIFCF